MSNRKEIIHNAFKTTIQVIIYSVVGFVVLMFFMIIKIENKNARHLEYQQQKMLRQQQENRDTTEIQDYNHYGYDREPTALCNDGKESYSLGRKGVCSHHGGVKYWYD